MAKVEDCPGFETFGERYFSPDLIGEDSAQRQRVSHKLKLCPEKYLPIVEATIDGAIKLEE